MLSGESDIVYKGPAPSWKVPGILSQSHFLILPTEGENFGHAIFDSLSCRTPVIITRNTPWNDLDTSSAGFYVEPISVEALKVVLLNIASMTSLEFESYRAGSGSYAKQYWEGKDYKTEYSFLFSNQ